MIDKSEIKFAFYGRVSTEDQQDPETSRNWQFARARSLIEPHGKIITEFFDVAQSRSIPWKRRPKAALLLEALKDSDRGFTGVVIGEPQRAFYGNQYGLTLPVLQHYGVQLWVPEVGGPIDPESEAHDMVMSVFGGMSKGKRTRIKVRVRTAMAAQAHIEGRYLGGRPPYGYQIADAGPHPNPSKAADGKRLRRLEPDPVAAPVVQRIFREYLSGIGIFAIAQRLTADGIACPSSHDRARNPHRLGVAWSKGAVRVILTNPRYTGYEVWNKQRKQELLIDVEDVALGYETKMAWNPRGEWIFSDKRVHKELVDVGDFEQVGQRLMSRGPRSTGRVTVRRKHGYALKGLLFHETCGRRMQGNWNHNMAHYRCRFPNEYAVANGIDHPLTVYIREDVILGELDSWLAQTFSPERVERSLTMLEAAQSDAEPVRDELRRGLTRCDRKLSQHRAALEAGADPALVATWTREVQSERAMLEVKLAACGDHGVSGRRMSGKEIAALVGTFGGLLTVLKKSDPGDKLEVYRQLGVKLTYNHEKRVVMAETQPQPPVCVLDVSEGGLAHYPHGSACGTWRSGRWRNCP